MSPPDDTNPTVRPLDVAAQRQVDAEESRAEAVEEADVTVILAPDQYQRHIYAESIEANLVDGDAIIFGHGFNIRFGYIKPPEEMHRLFSRYPEALARCLQIADRCGVHIAAAVDRKIGLNALRYPPKLPSTERPEG